MKNSLIIFENTLKSVDKEKAKELLEELSFNLTLKELKENCSLKELLEELLKLCDKLDLKSEKELSKIIKGVIKASVEDEKKLLFLKISEQERLLREIEENKIKIKNTLKSTFNDFEEIIKAQGLNSDFLSDAKLYEVQILGILSETAESAYLTTIERGEDIELTAKEITKNLIFNAINEGSFEKKRIIKISHLVLDKAFEIANETKLYPSALCTGAILGAWDAITEATTKFKKTIAYCTKEKDIKQKEKELIYIEDDFIFLLNYLAKNSQSPVREILNDILDTKLDSVLAKFKRVLQESKEELIFKLQELKNNSKIEDLSSQAKQKLNTLDEDAKALGLRLWKRAKSFIKKS